MADSASTILLQRIQSVGSNVNLWGGYVNTNLETLERASKGYQALAVTGDATISWTNYVATNTGSVARLKLTGTLAAAAVLTFPAYQNYISVENSAGAQVTIKCSGGTGVAIANGAKVLIYCDGVDYFNASPTVLGSGTVTVSGRIAGVTAGTAATDAVNKTQMETAIATAGLPATAGTVLVSSDDTTAGYLGQKIVEGTGIDATDSGAGNSTLTLSVDTTELEEFLALTGKINATLTTGTTAMVDRRRTRITGGTGTLPAMTDGSFCLVELKPAAGVTVTVGRNSQTIDGAAEDDTYLGDGGAGVLILYKYVSAGVVTSEIRGSVL